MSELKKAQLKEPALKSVLPVHKPAPKPKYKEDSDDELSELSKDAEAIVNKIKMKTHRLVVMREN